MSKEEKWLPLLKYNFGDTLRHISDPGEKGVVMAIWIEWGCDPQYKVSKGNEAHWWYERECIRTVKARKS